MRKGWVKIVAAAGVALLVAAACGDGEEEASPEEIVTIDFLQPLPKSVAFYPLFVGEQLGYFEEEGVSVNLLPSGDIPATVAVPAGNADIGATTPANIVVGAAQGEDFQLYYEYYQKNVFSIVVPEGSDVTEVADLEGGTVGITSEAAGDAALTRAALTQAGLDPDTDVEIAVIGEGGPTVAEALRTGSVDAYTGAINDLVAVQVEGISFTNITPENLNVLPASSMIIASGPADELSDAIAGFFRAWAKATYVGLVNDEVVFAMAKEEVPEEFEDESFGRAFMEQAIELQTPVIEDCFGCLRPDAWDEVQTQLIEGGELEEMIDSNSFLNDRFIDFANDWDRAEVEGEVEAWAAQNL